MHLAPRIDHDMYEIWLGIKFFWSDQGKFVTRRPPQETSDNPFEVAATKLKQSHLELARKVVRKQLYVGYKYDCSN